VLTTRGDHGAGVAELISAGVCILRRSRRRSQSKFYPEQEPVEESMLRFVQGPINIFKVTFKISIMMLVIKQNGRDWNVFPTKVNVVICYTVTLRGINQHFTANSTSLGTFEIPGCSWLCQYAMNVFTFTDLFCYWRLTRCSACEAGIIHCHTLHDLF